MAAEATSLGHPAIGTLVNGKYLVEKIIGEGGVGVVVAAQNIELGDRVALKFLRSEMLSRKEVVSRFMAEAKAACSIKSDRSASVFDVGRTAEGVPFLVMEFLEGYDLASVIESGRVLEVREAAEYAMQVCEALAAAHAKKIVHRDIKPENLFLETRAGMRSIKVLDFGISKTVLTGSVLGSSDVRRTPHQLPKVASSLLPMAKAQHLVGTPLYMSPEQIRTPEGVDWRTDIWSLGVVLYETVTGRLPFHSESLTELCTLILESPLPPLTEHRDDLPPGFVAVIERCLEKDAAERYQNVAAVALALAPFAPKRARICAERAGQALVAAGLVDEESVRFPSSIPSALSTGEHVAFNLSVATPSSSFAPVPPPPSSRSATPPPSSRSPTPGPVSRPLPISARASLEEEDLPTGAPSRAKKILVAAAAMIVAAFAIYGGVIVVRNGAVASEEKARLIAAAAALSVPPLPPPVLALEPAPVASVSAPVPSAKTSAPVKRAYPKKKPAGRRPGASKPSPSAVSPEPTEGDTETTPED